MPMMEKIVQTAKQMVKAIVENHRARLCSPLRKLSKVPIALGLRKSLSSGDKVPERSPGSLIKINGRQQSCGPFPSNCSERGVAWTGQSSGASNARLDTCTK